MFANKFYSCVVPKTMLHLNGRLGLHIKYIANRSWKKSVNNKGISLENRQDN